MLEDDIFSHSVPFTYDESYMVLDSQTVETIDLAFSWQQKLKFHKSPTQNYFYKNVLMRKVQRIRDLLGLVETDSIDNILRKVVLEKYSDGKMIEEEKKMKYVMEWKDLEDLYVTERTENIPRRNFMYDIIDYIKHSPEPTKAINYGLKTINQMDLCGNLSIVENCDCCNYFLRKTLQILNEKKNSNFSSQVVDILKTFCTSYTIEEVVILNTEIQLCYLIRVTQIERFNFASIWQEGNNRDFPLNWTLLEGNLEDFKLLLICGSPNAYDDGLESDFFTAIRPHFYDLVQNLPDDWEEDMDFVYENLNFLALQVLWLYFHFEDTDQRTESLILLWKSIPDPFLTNDMFIIETSSNDLCMMFEDCFEWYLNCLVSVGAEEEEPPSPRSLLHLATCSVRKSLTQNFVVPSDETFNMKHLGLPKKLQENVKLGVNVSLPNLV